MTTKADNSMQPSDPATAQSVKSDLEAAAWLFEQLAVESGQPADRVRIRRALEEASAAWPPGSEDRWWKWLVEAGRSLGMKCKIVDCTFDQLVEVAREGARLITRVGEERRWKAITVGRGRRLRVLRPLRDRQRVSVTTRRLRKMLEIPRRDAMARCLVIEPSLTGTEQLHLDQEEQTPLGRLTELLKPEASDLWMIVIFSLVTGVLALATPLAVETLVNTVAFGRLLQPVVILALMLLAFLSFSAALRALQTYVVEIMQRRLFARVAADLAYRLPRTEVEALDHENGRELVNRFFDVVTVQKVTAQLLLDGISLVLTAMIGMAVLAFYHPWLLGFDVVLLALIVFVILVLGRGAVDTSVKESKTKYQMAAWLEDLVGCPVAFRHNGAPEFALDRADRLIYEYLTARKKHFRVLMRQIIFALGLQAVASTVLLGLGGWLVITGQLTLGQLVAAELIVTVIVGSFAKFGKHLESYYDLMAAVDKLGVLFDLPMERQDGLLTLPGSGPVHVTLNHVCYNSVSGQSVLDNVQLEIPTGDRVVLTGPSGSGKSHLLDLLYGSRMPSDGHVTIEGIAPRDLRPDALRRNVALVRDVEIFKGTVLENVHLERPNVSTHDVRAALHKIGLLDAILHLPDGLETILVDRGYPLTANQTRKLMLARAIVSRPRLLLIDGMLDALPDDEVQSLMTLLTDQEQPWTLVLISGRDSINSYDLRRVDIENGNVAAKQEVMHAG
ncbi:MAG: ATP-binding cassette domain-containing protein [Planctomycetaceae bacterium]|nr:ATP-binding cassette domain-containing protein [Planctomycetaceae bacterium]